MLEGDVEPFAARLMLSALVSERQKRQSWPNSRKPYTVRLYGDGIIFEKLPCAWRKHNPLSQVLATQGFIALLYLEFHPSVDNTCKLLYAAGGKDDGGRMKDENQTFNGRCTRLNVQNPQIPQTATCCHSFPKHSQAFPTSSQAIPKHFPNVHNRYSNRFSIKHTPFFREISRTRRQTFFALAETTNAGSLPPG